MKRSACLAVAVLTAMTTALKVRTEAETEAEYFLPGWAGKSVGEGAPVEKKPVGRTITRTPRTRRSRRSRRAWTPPSESEESESSGSDSEPLTAVQVHDPKDNELEVVVHPEVLETPDPIVHPEAYGKLKNDEGRP